MSKLVRTENSRDGLWYHIKMGTKVEDVIKLYILDLIQQGFTYEGIAKITGLNQRKIGRKIKEWGINPHDIRNITPAELYASELFSEILGGISASYF